MDDAMAYEQFRDVCVHRVAELKFLTGSHKALMAHDEDQIEPPPDFRAASIFTVPWFDFHSRSSPSFLN